MDDQKAMAILELIDRLNTRVAALEAKCDRLRDRLRLVIEAAENYRACQGTLGDRHPETGRAWVAMRRGIEDARKTLAEGDR